MLIEQSQLTNKNLDGKVIIVTGGGGGIGIECTRALLWLGATVIIAEINRRLEKIFLELKTIYKEKILFYPIDIRKETQIAKLLKKAIASYGRIDGVINNATIAPIGALDEIAIKEIDHSYKVNLRAPALFYKYSIAQMKKQNSGVFITVSSSGAAPFLGAYEIFKTAQVEFSNTASMELEGEKIYAFTIGPGFVKTKTAVDAIKKIASKYNKSELDMLALLEEYTLTPEAAGVGFALAFVNALKYHGKEIGCIQVLNDFNIAIPAEKNIKLNLSDSYKMELTLVTQKVLNTYTEQYKGWMKRIVFEKQWLIRDFKKQVGCSCEEILGKIQFFLGEIKTGCILKNAYSEYGFDKLLNYYKHQIELLKGHEKNQEKQREYTDILLSYCEDIQKISNIIEEIKK